MENSITLNAKRGPSLQVGGYVGAHTAGPVSKGRAGNILIPTIEDVPVEDIEKLEPELNIHQLRDADILIERQIDIIVGKSSNIRKP